MPGAERAVRSLALVLVAVLAGACATSGASSAGPSGHSPTAATAPEITSSPSALPSAAPSVLEDAGIDVELAAEMYTSRVFTPRIELDLPSGWVRRDDVTPERVALRHAVDNIMLTIIHLDFVQCGSTLLDHPSAQAAADLVAGASVLSPGPRESVDLGDRTAERVALPGTGDAPEGDFDPATVDFEKLCILTGGAAPFPDPAGGWVVLTPDLRAELVFADVGDDLILLAGRSYEEPSEAIAALVGPVFATVRFPGSGAPS